MTPGYPYEVHQNGLLVNLYKRLGAAKRKVDTEGVHRGWQVLDSLTGTYIYLETAKNRTDQRTGQARPAILDLELARNVFGKLDKKLKGRVSTYLDSPNADIWDDIKGIMLTTKGRTNTVWQWVLRVDPTFPKVGRRTDVHGNVITEWVRIPTRDTLLRAIRLATRGT